MINKEVLYIAFRNLFTHRLRTLLTIFAVILGIGAIVFLVSLGYGLQKIVTEQVVNFDAFSLVDVTPGDSSIMKINDKVVDQLKGIANVDKVEPVIGTAGKISANNSLADVVIYGVSSDYLKLSNYKVETGKSLSFDKNSKEIVINKAVANLMTSDSKSLLEQNVKLNIILTKALTGKDEVVKADEQPYKVVGIDADNSTPYIYMPIQNLQGLSAIYYSGAKVRFASSSAVAGGRKIIENQGFNVEYIGDTVNQIDQVFNFVKLALGFFGLIAMIIAMLGMFNTLTISLLERTKEVGLLRALGANSSDIWRIFLAESFLIGIVGGLFGIVAGYIIGQVLNIIFSYYAEQSTGLLTLFYTPWLFMLGMAVFSIVVGFLTGIYPAKRAVKINALEAIRYE